jgi:tetratricopeptide (TPR) repeat protein
MVKRKRLWFVWKTPDGRFQVQALNAIMQPMSEARIIGPDEFEARYSHEPDQTASPGPRLDPGLAAGEYGVEEVLGFSPASPLGANDPDLLRSWLMKPVPAPSSEHADGLSPIQEVHLARLVDESLQTPLPDLRQGVVPGPGEEAPSAPMDAEQALRADFAMALLKIKQGKREEGLTILDSIIRWQGKPFDGAAELFSEFGLNLRRLGITSLALFAHRRALALAPHDERIHFNLARVYHDLKKYDSAREHLEKALEIAPGFTTARQFFSFLTGNAAAGSSAPGAAPSVQEK